MGRARCNGSHRRRSSFDLGHTNRAGALLAFAAFAACAERPTLSSGSEDAAVAGPSPEDAGEIRDGAIAEEASSSTPQNNADATFDAGDADASPDGACWSLAVVN